jgi:hypothetical protein
MDNSMLSFSFDNDFKNPLFGSVDSSFNTPALVLCLVDDGTVFIGLPHLPVPLVSSFSSSLIPSHTLAFCMSQQLGCIFVLVRGQSNQVMVLNTNQQHFEAEPLQGVHREMSSLLTCMAHITMPLPKPNVGGKVFKYFTKFVFLFPFFFFKFYFIK